MVYLSEVKLPVIVGAIAGSIPDVEHVLVQHGLMEQQVFISHVPWFPHGQWDLPGGLAVQIMLVVLCLIVCSRLRPW